jgi:hypothetical protein
VRRARDRGAVVTAPVSVIVEWWRGQRGPVAHLDVEPLEPRLVRVAGEALARTGRGPSPTDAVVMASAASRGDIVLASDIDDLERLRRAVFRDVRILRV